MKEVWRDIPGYVGFYQVSDLGKVKSLPRTVCRKGHIMNVHGRLLRQHMNNVGRMYVILSRDGKRVKWFVHRIVATAFLENPDNLPQINHINGNPKDNRLENLEWCNQSQNELHKIYILKVENSSLINQPKKVLIVEKGLVFNSLGEAHRHTGVPLHTIFSRLQNGKADMNGYHWKYVIE